MLEQVKSAIWESLAKELNAYGFVALPDKNQLRKYLDQDFQSVVLNCSSYEEGVIVEINLAVRIEEIERIANQFLHHSLSYQQESFTAIASKGKLEGKPYQKIWIEHQQDLLTSIDEIDTFLYRKGFHFLDKCMDLDFLHQSYNNKPQEPCPIAYNLLYRCFRGLIIANKTGANWQELAQTYQQELTRYGATPQTQNDFSALITYLQKQK